MSINKLKVTERIQLCQWKFRNTSEIYLRKIHPKYE